MSSNASRAVSAEQGVDVVGYLDRLKHIRLDTGLIEEVLDAYAHEHFDDEGVREQFMTEMTEPPMGPQVSEAALQVVFAVMAATELPTDQAFQALVKLLEIDKGEGVIHDLKHTFLLRMERESDVEPDEYFRRRLAYANDCIDGQV